MPNAISGDSLNYITAQQEAVVKRNGLWEYNINQKDTLDQVFLGAELMTEAELDSAQGSSFFGSFFVNSTNEERVLLEVIAAPIVGIPFAFLGGFAASGLGSFGGAEGWDNLGYAIIGAYLGYTLGNAAGVYVVAKNGEKEVTFGETFLASAFGAAVGSVIFLSSNNSNNNNQYLDYLPLVLPGFAAIIYVNIMADDKVDNGYNYGNSQIYINQNIFGLTHQDLLNSQKIIELNVLRINF